MATATAKEKSTSPESLESAMSSLSLQDSTSLIKQARENDRKENFCFFLGKDSPFSNFHPAQFTTGDVLYSCSEQYMMHQKAVLFGDEEHAGLILKEKRPVEMKNYGRLVQNFNQEKWNAECDNIVKRGVFAKFDQNQDLRQKLFDTFPKILVEASPGDKIWGIGLKESDMKAWSRKTWRGKNKLGYILTEVRNELMEKHGIFSEKSKPR